MAVYVPIPSGKSLKDKKVVVIGGAGFLGGHIVDALEQIGAQTTIFDIRPVERRSPLTTTVVGDLCNFEQVLAALKGAHVVFFMASPPPESNNRPLFLKVHVQGTETVLRACEAAGVPRFVLTSSASVLYDGTDLLDATEDHPYAAKPADPYTETKIYQEQIVLKANTAKLQTIALRPHTIFGPKDQCITTMVEQGRKGSLKFIVGDGQNIVDVTYVPNLVHAHLLAAESLTPGSTTSGKAYHITNDEPVKFWEFTGNVLEVYGLPRPSIPIPAKLLLALTIVVAFVMSLLEPLTGPIKNTFTPSRIRLASTHHSYSCARAKAELGYRPLYNNMQSIVATYQQSTARK